MESYRNNEQICPKCSNPNKQGEKVCYICGYNFAEDSLLEITDTLEGVRTFGICCTACLAVILIIAAVGLFVGVGIIQGIIGSLIMAACMVFLVLYIKSLTPHATKIRRFTITNDEIEISLPTKPIFQVSWSEFDTIEINRRIKGSQEFKRTFYAFIFTGKTTNSIILEGGKDFKNIYKRIIPQLKEIATSKGKQFIGYTKKDKEAKAKIS